VLLFFAIIERDLSCTIRYEDCIILSKPCDDSILASFFITCNRLDETAIALLMLPSEEDKLLPVLVLFFAIIERDLSCTIRYDDCVILSNVHCDSSIASFFITCNRDNDEETATALLMLMPPSEDKLLLPVLVLLSKFILCFLSFLSFFLLSLPYFFADALCLLLTS
jgi:hypothetical protein